MTARMGDQDCRDALRDALALVTANRHPEMAEHGDSFTVALRLVKLQDGETPVHWLERIATTLDLLAHCAGAWMDQWAESSGMDGDELLRRFCADFAT